MTEHPFEKLAARGKEPTAKRNLDTWISQAVEKTGIAPTPIVIPYDDWQTDFRTAAKKPKSIGTYSIRPSESTNGSPQI